MGSVTLPTVVPVVGEERVRAFFFCLFVLAVETLVPDITKHYHRCPLPVRWLKREIEGDVQYMSHRGIVCSCAPWWGMYVMAYFSYI